MTIASRDILQAMERLKAADPASAQAVIGFDGFVEGFEVVPRSRASGSSPEGSFSGLASSPVVAGGVLELLCGDSVADVRVVLTDRTDDEGCL